MRLDLKPVAQIGAPAMSMHPDMWWPKWLSILTVQSSCYDQLPHYVYNPCRYLTMQSCGAMDIFTFCFQQIQTFPRT